MCRHVGHVTSLNAGIYLVHDLEGHVHVYKTPHHGQSGYNILVMGDLDTTFYCTGVDITLGQSPDLSTPLPHTPQYYYMAGGAKWPINLCQIWPARQTIASS